MVKVDNFKSATHAKYWGAFCLLNKAQSVNVNLLRRTTNDDEDDDDDDDSPGLLNPKQ